MTDTAASGLSHALIALFKGVVYADTDHKVWPLVMKHRAEIADHVKVLGLQVSVHENDGFAFLRSLPQSDGYDYPRLVSRHKLPYHLSLLLALLRKRLAEFDAHSSDPRLLISRTQITEMMAPYMRATNDEVRRSNEVARHINAAIKDLGVLQPLKGDDQQYEVRRILTALFTGDELADLNQQLDDYITEIAAPTTEKPT